VQGSAGTGRAPALSPSARLRLRVRRPSGRAVALLTSSWLLGVLIVLVSWRPLPTTPAVGLDPSWTLALQLAAAERLHWGTELIFNYGPLGFLDFPLVAVTWAAILSALFLIAIRLALAVSIIWIARRRLGLPLALLVAFVTVSLSGGGRAAVSLAFIWCAVAIAEDPPGLARRVVLFGGGALSALELLMKVNEGLLIAVMCAVAAVTMRGSRPRNVLSFGLTFLACLVAVWFAAGQGVSNVADFAVSVAQQTRGYSSALASSQGGGWQPLAALAVWAAALVAAWLSSRDLAISQRVGLLLLVLGLGFVAWKEGFVRQDAGHMPLFFSWLLVPWIALPWSGRLRVPAIAGFATVAVLYFAAPSFSPQNQFRPIESVKTAVSDLRIVFDPGRRESTRLRARFGMAVAYQLDARSLGLLKGKTVAVWPWEIGIAWAYGLDWKPPPVFHSTSAYTSWLDDRAASGFASPRGPQRILRHGTNPNAIEGPRSLGSATRYGIDGRYLAYDAPAATLAMLCNFSALRTTERYQVLGRVPDRCGPPRLLRSTSAEYGQQVGIPRPPGRDDVVFVRVHGAAPSGVEALRTLLYRPLPTYIVFNGRKSYHLVPTVAGDGLILTARPELDFPKPFALAPNPRTVELLKDSGPFSPHHGLSFDFYAMRVRP
jgi:hypothetical protein